MTTATMRDVLARIEPLPPENAADRASKGGSVAMGDLLNASPLITERDYLAGRAQTFRDHQHRMESIRDRAGEQAKQFAELAQSYEAQASRLNSYVPSVINGQ